MSATSEELASQAEQLQAAISYFRIDAASLSQPANEPAARTDLKAQILAKAPHMSPRKPGKAKSKAGNGGGFDLDMGEAEDDLDGDFTRRGAA
ncbi:hypothetical protein D3C86_1745990 [compost metagenome]